MSPGCYLNDCNTWGIQKAYDGRTRGLSSLPHTSKADSLPFFQLDVGANPPNITAVRIVARADGYLVESQYLNVYVSSTTSWTASTATLCAASIVFGGLGETTTVLCPTGFAWAPRYVTVVLNSTANPQFNGYLSLQEVTPLYEGRHLGSLTHAVRGWAAFHAAQRAFCLHSLDLGVGHTYRSRRP